MSLVRGIALLVLPALVGTAGCGDDDGAGQEGASIVVTTNILGDIVTNLVGDDVRVEVVMPPNANPHDFAASAKQVAAMREADVLVVNGLGFEEGLDDTIDAAAGDGVSVLTLTDLVPGHLAAGEEAHEEEEHEAEEHGHEGEDPHVFTDPARMAVATAALAEELADQVDGLDTPAFRERAAAYVADLEALDGEVEALVAAVPAERRVLVTNHEVFGYFADRYGFEVLGAVIPSLSTLAEPSAADLADLAAAIADAGVPAIFAESSSPTRLADALAAEGTDVEVVELFGESLGSEGSGGETYVDMVRTNAERIVGALT
jgi:zinc/manganese transport system substrate-binding protein